jgi:hypothetical protein
MLANFVDVDFWQNNDVECRPKTNKFVDLHLARTPLTPPYKKFEGFKQNLQMNKANKPKKRMWQLGERVSQCGHSGPYL